jgi:BirA family biotin operon repressor/biotin-[acetyl-CoA-carboxylase] ligase
LSWKEKPVPDRAAWNLATLRQGVSPFHLHFFTRLRSTNDHAAAIRKQRRLFAPSIVLTAHQTVGRGRGSNVWWSNACVLTATFVLSADENLPAGELPLIAGIAVRDAAAELTGQPGIELKWPNDCLYGRRKLGGLLCERLDKLDLIGIGLNINVDPEDAPSPLRKSLTSLRQIAGRPIDQNQTLMVLASHLRQNIDLRRRQPFGYFLGEYQKHHALLGRKVAVSSAGTPTFRGKVEGIDEQARLILRDGSTIHRVVAGNVELL